MIKRERPRVSQSVIRQSREPIVTSSPFPWKVSLSFFGGLTSPRPVQTLQKKINSRGVRIRRGGLKPRRRKRTNTFRPLNGKQILLETLYYESRKTNKEDGGGTGQSPESVTDCAQSPREGTRPPPGYQEEVPRRGLKKWMPPCPAGSLLSPICVSPALLALFSIEPLWQLLSKRCQKATGKRLFTRS